MKTKTQKMFLNRGQRSVVLPDGTYSIAEIDRPDRDGEYLVFWTPQDQFATVSTPAAEATQETPRVIHVEAGCEDLKTGRSDATYLLCDSFGVEGFLEMLREHLNGLIDGTHGLTGTAPEDTRLTLSITLRDPETIMAPVKPTRTVRQVLAGMTDGDATAALSLLEERVLELNDQSHCAKEIIRMFTGLHDYLKISEQTHGNRMHSLLRWKLWDNAIHTAHVIMNG